MRFAELWSWDGKISRGAYATVGFLALAIKYNLDRAITSLGFHRLWSFSYYWAPLGETARLTQLSAPEKQFLVTMVAISLPFLWVGVTQTIRRLRDAGQPLWLAVFFFLPFVNVVFLLLLCVLPSKEEAEQTAARGAGALASVLPKSRWGSAAVATVLAAIVTVVLTWLSVWVMGSYGWSLFVALPFCMGYLAALLYSYHQPRSLLSCLSVATFSVLLAGAGIAAVAIEGIFCLAMAAPIALGLAYLGALLAYFVQNRRWSGAPTPASLGIVLLCVPLLMGAEYTTPPPVPRFEVHTRIEIAAPPEIVWHRVVAFPAIPSASEWPFRLGISYPIEARLKGSGLTADRECRFSTGSFREPILVWDEPRHFRFAVADEPPLMREWSPYGAICVRHLEDHDFRAEAADFALTPLPNGRTLLEGTSTYQNKMWPSAYWRYWTDAFVHHIQQRVFAHIKWLAEADAAETAGR